MQTKLQKVRDLWAKAQYLDALRIVAKFQDLGDDREQILRGFECSHSPAFYVQLGYNPTREIFLAFAAMSAKYSLPILPV